MIKYLIAKVAQEEAERRMKDKRMMMYAAVGVLAGVGAYVSYRAIKNCMADRELEEDLEYLQSYEDELDQDYYENEYIKEKTKKREEAEDEELREKVDEFNSRRLNFENEGIVSPKELSHYVDQIKVDKDNTDINEEDLSKEKYDEYDE